MLATKQTYVTTAATLTSGCSSKARKHQTFEMSAPALLLIPLEIRVQIYWSIIPPYRSFYKCRPHCHHLDRDHSCTSVQELEPQTRTIHWGSSKRCDHNKVPLAVLCLLLSCSQVKDEIEHGMTSYLAMHLFNIRNLSQKLLGQLDAKSVWRTVQTVVFSSKSRSDRVAASLWISVSSNLQLLQYHASGVQLWLRGPMNNPRLE